MECGSSLGALSEMRTTAIMNAERIATAAYDEGASNIRIRASVKFNFGDREMGMKSSEEWTLKDGGNTLEIVQASAGFRGGDDRSVLVFEKVR